LEDIGFKQNAPTVIFMDNATSITMVIDEGNFAKRKHIRVKYHAIRDWFKEKIIAPTKIDTRLQQADILTKPLGRQMFEPLRNAVLGITDEVILNEK
jgi:hypothetical protein